MTDRLMDLGELCEEISSFEQHKVLDLEGSLCSNSGMEYDGFSRYAGVIRSLFKSNTYI